MNYILYYRVFVSFSSENEKNFVWQFNELCDDVANFCNRSKGDGHKLIEEFPKESLDSSYNAEQVQTIETNVLGHSMSLTYSL
jgi:hypothetical protein